MLEEVVVVVVGEVVVAVIAIIKTLPVISVKI